MCRNNENGGRRCPASTNKEVRREQNRKYYEDHKPPNTATPAIEPLPASLTTQPKILNALPAIPPTVPTPRTTKSVVDDIDNVITNILKKNCIINYSKGALTKPADIKPLDWGRIATIAARVRDEFNTTLTTPSAQTVECKTTDIFFSKRDGETKISGNIFIDGASAGKFIRTIYKLQGNPCMDYDQFDLNKNFQGQGIGTQLITHFDTASKSLGINQVTTRTSLVGGYVWAKAGYNWNPHEIDNAGKPHGVNKIIETLEKYKSEQTVNANEKNQINNMISRLNGKLSDPNYPTPLSIANLGKAFIKSNGLWVGKSVLINSQWDGIRDI